MINKRILHITIGWINTIFNNLKIKLNTTYAYINKKMTYKYMSDEFDDSDQIDEESYEYIQRRLTAFHEAGHAVVAILSGLSHCFPTEMTIVQDMEKGYYGRVFAWGLGMSFTQSSDKDCNSNNEQFMKWHNRISAAGDIAEDIICDREFSNDLNEIDVIFALRLNSCCEDYKSIYKNLDTF